MLRIVRYAEVPSMPWRNGRGLTRQLAIHPPHASIQQFEWRISIAQLEQTAEFSVYPGIERCLAVLEGELRLVHGAATSTLRPESAPVCFSGDEASIGEVVGPPVLDLNVMYHPEHWRVALLPVATSDQALPSTALGTLVCPLAALHVRIGDREITLERYDLLLASREAGQCIPVSKGCAVYCIQLERC